MSRFPGKRSREGYEYEKDQYIEITDEDLDKADVELTQDHPDHGIRQEDEIDPLYFDKPYYLEPQKGGERAYAPDAGSAGAIEEGRDRQGRPEIARTSGGCESGRRIDDHADHAVCP